LKEMTSLLLKLGADPQLKMSKAASDRKNAYALARDTRNSDIYEIIFREAGASPTEMLEVQRLAATILAECDMAQGRQKELSPKEMRLAQRTAIGFQSVAIEMADSLVQQDAQQKRHIRELEEKLAKVPSAEKVEKGETSQQSRKRVRFT